MTQPDTLQLDAERFAEELFARRSTVCTTHATDGYYFVADTADGYEPTHVGDFDVVRWQKAYGIAPDTTTIPLRTWADQLAKLEGRPVLAVPLGRAVVARILQAESRGRTNG